MVMGICDQLDTSKGVVRIFISFKIYHLQAPHAAIRVVSSSPGKQVCTGDILEVD